MKTKEIHIENCYPTEVITHYNIEVETRLGTILFSYNDSRYDELLQQEDHFDEYDELTEKEKEEIQKILDQRCVELKETGC